MSVFSVMLPSDTDIHSEDVWLFHKLKMCQPSLEFTVFFLKGLQSSLATATAN